MSGVIEMLTRMLIDGRETDVEVDLHLVDEVLVPVLEQVGAAAQPHRRRYVFLVAPPGTGKSTLAAILKDRARHLDLDVVGMDGFHHAQAYLESHHLERGGERVPLSAVKGAPETFDVDGLARQLELGRTRSTCWPRYDRVLHDVVPGAEPVEAGLVLVEGNYLLLDEPGWSELSDHSDFNIFLEPDADALRERLVSRKVRGGLSRSAATEFYDRSDRHNVERVLAGTDRSKVDLLLHLDIDGATERRDRP
ncbi:MAG TPA: nucleoside/nucleotide kinase family protein [Nocardioides sp.]